MCICFRAYVWLCSPWHGAAFDCRTGDIEEAPALDPLPSYGVRIADGRVFVSCPQSDEAKSSKRTIEVDATAASAPAPAHFVIVGGGAAACVAADTLRVGGFQGSITMLSKDAYLPYDRTKLSKSPNAAEDMDKILLRNQSYYDSINVKVRLNTTVTAIDTQAKKITLHDGTSISYTQVLLATGSDPKPLPLPGNDARNVHFIRTPENVRALWSTLQAAKPAQIAIVGAGFIGLELAAWAVKQPKDVVAGVTVVMSEDIPFAKQWGERIGKAVQARHEKEGVRFVSGAKITAIEAKEDDTAAASSSGSKRVASGVVTENKGVVSANVIVLAVGAKLNTDWLKSDARVELSNDGGVVVDHFFYQRSSGVYAAGDIASYPYVQQDFKRQRIEHWAVAQQQGRTAALNMLGLCAPDTYTPFFWTAQHVGFRYCGHATEFDDILYDESEGGAVEELKFVAYYCKGGQVQAVLSAQRDPIVQTAAELMRRNRMPNKQQLLDAKFDLKSFL